jgi:glycosyltransferase involved in cell wall biosynthesis
MNENTSESLVIESPTKKPKVTVCMCTRNRAIRMLPAIKSIISQDFGLFEFIIINDASEDSTQKVLMQCSQQDPRIKIITLSTHNFITARNCMMLNTNSDYVAIMDSDDLCSPDKLAEQVKFLDEHPDIDVVGCKVKFGKLASKYSIPNTQKDWGHDFFEEAIKTENISMLLHFPTVMIRKSTLDRIFKNKIYFYPELQNGGEDTIFLYALYLNGAKFANISKPTYLYNYLEPDSISSTIGKHFDDNNFIFKYIHDKPLEQRLAKVKELYDKYENYKRK